MISQGLEYFEGLKRMSIKTVTNLTRPTIFQKKKQHTYTLEIMIIILFS